MSVSVSITIKAKPEKFDELKAALMANLPETQKFEGNELIRLVAPQERPDILLLFEEWAAIENFRAYKAWRNETDSSAVRPDLLAAPLEVVISDILF